MKPRAWVFDAYGTLFDVRSVMDRCESVFPGQGAAITTLWRAKQLEYSWLRSLMGRYEDFWRVTEDALRYTCRSLGLEAAPDQMEAIMASYMTISPFPDTVGALQTLAGQGQTLAVLSNGSPAMLKAAVEQAGLASALAHVISVDAARIYKPHPAVYRLAVERLQIPQGEIGFVSSNGWDAAGAKAFGYVVCWLNRSGLPVEELDVRPDRVISSLFELAC